MFRILTFQLNGHPMPIEINKYYDTREEAEERLKYLQTIYDIPLFISGKDEESDD